MTNLSNPLNRIYSTIHIDCPPPQLYDFVTIVCWLTCFLPLARLPLPLNKLLDCCFLLGVLEYVNGENRPLRNQR